MFIPKTHLISLNINGSLKLQQQRRNYFLALYYPPVILNRSVLLHFS